MSVAASPEVYCPPTHLWVPPGSTFEAGAEAADLARALGYSVEQPERDALNVLLAESADGDWAALETGIIGPRQNIKTAMMEVTCWRDLLIRDVRRVTWSAHLYKTTRDAFADMKRIVETYDWVAQRVDKVRESNGEEGFEFTNGATMDFLARSKGSGRGLGGDTVVLDEALYLSTDTQGALIPTLSTAPKAHVRYGSSPGKLESAALRALRNRARTGSDPTLAWIEWSTPQVSCEDPECLHRLDTPGCMLDDEDAWARVNPALDRRITRKYVRAERRGLATDPWEFLRERMGVWQDPPNADGAVDNGMPGWVGAGEVTAQATSPFTVGVEVSTDSRSAAVALHGAGVVELVDYRIGKGTGWVAGRVRDLSAKWGARVAARRGSPTEQLRAALPGDTTWVPATEFAAACMGFATAVNEGTLRHRDQDALNVAASAADRVSTPRSDVWRWSLSKSAHQGTDISPLLAAVVARHLASASPAYDPLANFMP